jgi:hypothetical protein
MKSIVPSSSEHRVQKPMGEMEPLEIGKIINNSYSNAFVMRTASVETFEVMNLTDMKAKKCWTLKGSGLNVEIMPKGFQVTLEVE